MKLIITYIKKIFKQWIILLGLIPTAIDYIATFSNFNLNFPIELNFTVFLISFFISSYYVWKEEKIRNNELVEKYKNPIDYEVVVEVNPLDDKVKESLEKIQKNIDDAQNECNNITVQRNEIYTSVEFIHNRLITSNINNYYNIDTRSYEERLISYRDQLNNYIQEMKNYIEEMYSYYDKRKGKIYYAIFKIHNIGVSSDENIDINIFSNNSLFSDCPDFEEPPKHPDRPEKPKKEIEINQIWSDRMHDLYDIGPINDYHLEAYNAFRKKYKINKDNVSVILRELNVGDNINIFREGVYIKSENLDDLEIEIKSKESNQKIKKKINVLIKQPLSFIDILNKDN